jgi:transposase
MGKVRPPHPAEFRRQMVELVRAGRAPAELSREFELTAQSIHTWVRHYERDSGERLDGGLNEH